MARSAASILNLVRPSEHFLHTRLSADRQTYVMPRPNLSTQRSVPLVSSCELLGSLTLVRVLVGENGGDVATSAEPKTIFASEGILLLILLG